MDINQKTNTQNIQEAFSGMFPYLKIEFIKRSHAVGEGSGKRSLINRNMKLGDINPNIQAGGIHITPVLTCAALEQRFQRRFGIPVQVFRKEGLIWIETTNTDGLSLGEQNEKGKASMVKTPRETRDRQLEEGQY